MPILIAPWIAELRCLGALGVDSYEQKLLSFGQNEQKIFEFLSEARAALLFLRNGIGVTMQDRPDLRLEFHGETIYAEVKHQNEKATDRRDDAALRAHPLEFIQVGNVIDDEGQHGYQGMCATAMKKEPQYKSGAPNILVFVNHSEALDLMLTSAANEFDDHMRKQGAQSPLRKLCGMMMFNATYGPSTGWSNVEFCYLSYALHAVNPRFVERMRQGQLA
jgi:hypothetical protein